MVMGEVGREYDLVVLGGGPAGYIAAIRAGELGLDVALIEKAFLGGVCLNAGCIPSKMLLNASHLVSETKYLTSIGISAKVGKVDMKTLSRECQRTVAKLRGGIAQLLQANGVEVIEGIGRFESSGHMHIKEGKNARSIRFRKAIIATGSRPYVPDGIRIGGNIITSSEALFLEELPKSVAIIGAGYIAAELGTFFAEMGSKVSILARSRLLSKMDQDLVQEVCRQENISIYEGCTVKSVRDGKVAKVAFASENVQREVSAEKVIVAIGRTPNTSNIGLENTRVALDKDGFVQADYRGATSDPKLFAAGDVAGPPLLAHKAFMQGEAAAEAAAGVAGAGFQPKAIPEVVFTNPEIVCVGVSEEEAKKKMLDVRVARLPLSAVGKAVSTNAQKGFCKIVHSPQGLILGVHMVGKGVSELAAGACLAVEMGAYIDDVAGTVHPHPTLSECLHECAQLALGRPWHYAVGKMKK
ncbi:MAG: dihydrolipoyl dehydrogenase [Candidatus Micrarchaeia archaeon]